MNCEQAQEWITALVDDELSKEERAAVEEHIRACPECQEACERERLIKDQVRRASASMTAPAALRQKVEQMTGSSDPWRRGWIKLKDFLAVPLVRPALALVLLLVIAYPLMFRDPGGSAVATAALSIHAMIQREEKTLTRVADPGELTTQLVRAVNGRFAPMGFDLSMMKLYPVAGFREVINGREVLVTVYEGQGPTVTCFTFLGAESDAPGDSTVFFDEAKRINFYSYTMGEFHAVMHREGAVICVMVSKMPPADLLAMVRDKARRS